MTLAEVHDVVSEKLNELRPLFKPECQLTFVMRLPGNDDCEMVITNDDIDGLIATLQRCKVREARP